VDVSALRVELTDENYTARVRGTTRIEAVKGTWVNADVDIVLNDIQTQGRHRFWNYVSGNVVIAKRVIKLGLGAFSGADIAYEFHLAIQSAVNPK
jgi:hypothetical protein